MQIRFDININMKEEEEEEARPNQLMHGETDLFTIINFYV